MTDVGFPVIVYQRDQSPLQWGRAHGESYRTAIHELAEIRLDLMREKNPGLNDARIERLAAEQWKITQLFDAKLGEELSGIADGADVSKADIVVVNNYTDFRDIHVPDQGCSLAYANAGKNPIAGQTWDMHGSAKNYVCCIDIPRPNDGRVVAFSVVGCVGMMGYNSHGGMLGVNNINTDGATVGAMWPAIVRRVLEQENFASMAKWLTESPKTSGHNYLIAFEDQADMWEVAPGLNDRVDYKDKGEIGTMFHTNHCLGEEMKKREAVLAQNSTTYIRYDLLEKKIAGVTDFGSMVDLMNDHENYPKSICSNFQSDSQDPSVTCGGAAGDLVKGNVMMWRGDKLHDENYVEHSFQLR